jgi:hypothetical protein
MADNTVPPEVHVYEVDVSDEQIKQLRQTGDLTATWEPLGDDADRVEVILHYDDDRGSGVDGHRVTETLE